MQNLLFEILQSPLESTINTFEIRLDTVEGSCEFLTLLKDNNPIAFTYMKMKIKDWSGNNNRINNLLSHKNIFYNLIDSSTSQNFELYCDTLENMSYCGILWDDFIDFLTHKDSHRSLRALNFIFKKFRILKKSNELYSEIIQSILKTFVLFTKHYLESSNPSVDPNLLEMYYSLVYQDIHPFFEDNSSKFFSSFVILYKHADLQNIISDIYNLYISKYPECIDMTQILGSVLTSITKYDFRKYQILLNITRRKNIHAVSKFKNIFINAIQFGAVLSDKEKDEIKENTLEYTRNILKNQDNYRGMISEIINYCKGMFGEVWMSKLISSGLDKEMKIFFYLSIKDKGMVDECVQLIDFKSSKNDFDYNGSRTNLNTHLSTNLSNNLHSNDTLSNYITIIALRYLIQMEEYHFVGVNCFNFFHQGKYFAFYYLKKVLDKQFGSRDLFLSTIGFGDNTLIHLTMHLDPYIFLNTTLEFIINNPEDEFSSGLLLSILKYRHINVSIEQLESFYSYLKENILNINSIASYNTFFDILGLIYLEDKNDKFILELVDVILREDLVELYSSTFFLLSLVVLNSNLDLKGLLQIITIEKLWSTKELRLSLVCLTISLYKKGYCSREQLNYILDYLPNYYSNILLINTISNFTIKENDLEELFILKTALVKGNNLSIDEYRTYYFDIINYFINNFITKKNIRRVLRALIAGSVILNKKEGLKEIMEKNYNSLDYGNIPISVIIVFDI